VAVGDNSLEQAISTLRRLLGRRPDGGGPYIETAARRGYRFAADVTRTAPRTSDAGLELLLAPHRAFVEGRSALETLERDEIARARQVFERALQSAPEHASAHVGLANACMMQFEMTRADPQPDAAALALGARHAREACRLDPQSGEAWATLGFVLDRTGDHLDALAASKRAVALEPDNWQHHFRLAYVGWGEERLRAAHRTLALLPDFPLARWLAATVHVGRQALGEAEQELSAGLAAVVDRSPARPRFSAVALHWLMGLICLTRGDEQRALDEFERELSMASSHVYGREVVANTWYAIGALELRRQRSARAREAFEHAIAHVGTHPFARVGLSAASGMSHPPAPGRSSLTDVQQAGEHSPTVDAAMLKAADLVGHGRHAEAAQIVERSLASAPAGSAGWLLPIEPLLRVADHPHVWVRALALLRNRAA
jgi:tetratricopeptide (TPR) repeat protein